MSHFLLLILPTLTRVQQRGNKPFISLAKRNGLFCLFCSLLPLSSQAMPLFPSFSPNASVEYDLVNLGVIVIVTFIALRIILLQVVRTVFSFLISLLIQRFMTKQV